VKKDTGVAQTKGISVIVISTLSTDTGKFSKKKKMDDWIKTRIVLPFWDMF